MRSTISAKCFDAEMPRVCRWIIGALAIVMLAGIPARAGLTINPIYDSTITSDPNGAVIQSTINSVIQGYEARFSDSISINIQFQEGGGLGSSSTFFVSVPYSTYRSLLAADQKTANDALALAHLPSGLTNPVNGSGSMNVTTANYYALGGGAVNLGGQPDSTITLNTAIMNLGRTSINAAKYDLQAVVSHEIDEAMGIGSALNGLSNADAAPTGAAWGEDLYRFDQNGVRSLTTSLAAQSYFSIDGGTTQLARFNQTAGGDFSDWYSPGGQAPQVQDAFGTPGSTPNLAAELTALDVLGYDLVPEPATLSLLVMAGAGALIRRRR